MTAHRQRIWSRLAGTALVVVAVTLPIGACGSKTAKLHPVSGKVFLEDTAPEGATVVFQPVNASPEAPMPSGTVDGDGSFRLSTHPHGEGAPAGEYIVLITWYPPDAREAENTANKLAERYADPTQPLLRATVKPGKNELEPFRLTK